MNAKLSYWFKFYMYMKKVGEFHELKISIIKVRKKNYRLLGNIWEKCDKEI